MKIFVWHRHGSYMTSLVQGRHHYLLPVIPGNESVGLGRAPGWDPEKVTDVTPGDEILDDVDVAIFQQSDELELAMRWLPGRCPGVDLPAVYLEHNPPPGPFPATRHPAAEVPGMLLVHVTHFNALFWNTGVTPTRVIEHGIADHGYRYSGELERCAAAINDPIRRAWATGSDLLAAIAQAAPIDLFGIGAGALGGIEAPPREQLHVEMARRRVYLHTTRWTSLGMTLLEAMQLGMPVVALATTEAPDAVPADAGTVSTNVTRLRREIERLMRDPDAAREKGLRARAAVLTRYSLSRFLDDWDQALADAVAMTRS